MILLLGCSPTYSAQTKLQPPSSRQIYFGAFPDFGGSEDHVSRKQIEDFETIAGRKLVWAVFSQNWFRGIAYPKAHIHAIHNAGVIPYVRLMPRSDEIQGHSEQHFTLQRIIDGAFDADLIQWARDARADGIPILADFAVEMNGDWFPWSGVFNGGAQTDGYGDPKFPDGPERYRDAYRHIIDLFRVQHVAHITWVFHINLASSPDAPWNRPVNYYPGDHYIDWVGFSLYGAQTLSEPWGELAFSTQLQSGCAAFKAITAAKPRAVLEFGVTDGYPDGNKSAWFNDAFAAILHDKCTPFRVISPWHEDWQNEDESWSRLRLDSSPEVKTTVRGQLHNPRFTSEAVLR